MFAAIVVLAVFYIVAGWVAYAMGDATPIWLQNAIAITKYAVSCLSCLTVWTIWDERIDNRDIYLLRAAFTFLVCADTCMVLLFPFINRVNPSLAGTIQTVGIIFFMIVQTCFIVRHSRETLKLLRTGNRRTTVKNIAVEILILMCVTIPVVAAVYFSTKKEVLVIVAYGVYVIFSLYTAWGVFRRDFYPKLNKWMIALGMTCFFLCDLNVGLSFVSKFADALVWMFYTPALVLLSYSGVKMANAKKS